MNLCFSQKKKKKKKKKKSGCKKVIANTFCMRCNDFFSVMGCARLPQVRKNAVFFMQV